jgi:hypothetical protein
MYNFSVRGIVRTKKRERINAYQLASLLQQCLPFLKVRVVTLLCECVLVHKNSCRGVELSVGSKIGHAGQP